MYILYNKKTGYEKKRQRTTQALKNKKIHNFKIISKLIGE